MGLGASEQGAHGRCSLGVEESAGVCDGVLGERHCLLTWGHPPIPPPPSEMPCAPPEAGSNCLRSSSSVGPGNGARVYASVDKHQEESGSGQRWRPLERWRAGSHARKRAVAIRYFSASRGRRRGFNQQLVLGDV